MPPARKGRGRGSGGFGRGGLLGKRNLPDDGVDESDIKAIGEGIIPGPPKRIYENQNSFANFMIKKGDVINRLLQEKEETSFKSIEWLEKKEKAKKVVSKHTKNLKQIVGNDPYND